MGGEEFYFQLFGNVLTFEEIFENVEIRGHQYFSLQCLFWYRAMIRVTYISSRTKNLNQDHSLKKSVFLVKSLENLSYD